MIRLPVSGTRVGMEGFEAMVATPSRALIALDFDGTLAPIVADPADARPHPGAMWALARLAPVLDMLAIITGRPAETAVRYGGLSRLSGTVTVLGHYGFQRWQAGETVSPEPPAGLALVRAELPELVTREPGVRTEDKGLSLAVHTRGCPDPEGAFRRLRDPLADLATRGQLRLEPGRWVLELRPSGMDKGTALRSLVDEQDPGAVLFAGDDLGDLPAFDAVAELRRRGTPGVAVWCRSSEAPALAQQADVVVDGSAGLAELLETLAAALGR